MTTFAVCGFRKMLFVLGFALFAFPADPIRTGEKRVAIPPR